MIRNVSEAMDKWGRLEDQRVEAIKCLNAIDTELPWGAKLAKYSSAEEVFADGDFFPYEFPKKDQNFSLVTCHLINIYYQTKDEKRKLGRLKVTNEIDDSCISDDDKEKEIPEYKRMRKDRAPRRAFITEKIQGIIIGSEKDRRNLGQIENNKNKNTEEK